MEEWAGQTGAMVMCYRGEAAPAQRSTWRRCRSNAALRPSCPILPPRPPSTSSTSALHQPVMREVVGLASTASPSKAWAAAKAASPPSSSAHGQAAKRQLQEEAPQARPPPPPLAGRDSPRGTGGSLALSLPALPHSLLTALPPLPNLVQDFVITAVSGSAAGPGAQAANAAPSEAAPGARTLPAAAPPAPPAPTISPNAVAQQSPPAVVEALSSGSPSPGGTAAATEVPAAPPAPPARAASLHRSPAVSHAVRSLGPVAESSPAMPLPPLPILAHAPQVGAGWSHSQLLGWRWKRGARACPTSVRMPMCMLGGQPLMLPRSLSCADRMLACRPHLPPVQAAPAGPAPARSMSLTRQLSRKLSRGWVLLIQRLAVALAHVLTAWTGAWVHEVAGTARSCAQDEHWLVCKGTLPTLTNLVHPWHRLCTTHPLTCPPPQHEPAARLYPPPPAPRRLATGAAQP